jgi:hypothetical protein
MGIDGGVTVRLASLCLDDDGRLRDYFIWDTAARGALLLDLALAGRLTETDDSVDIDPTPTGFAPADSLLAAIAVEPERSLDWWIQRGGVRMADVADAIVRAGRWTERRHLFGRRFQDQQAEQTAADRARVFGTPDPGWSPETAAVVAVTTAAGEPGHRPKPPEDAVLRLTGPLQWICRTVVEQLGIAQLQNRTIAAAEGGGVGGGPIY